MAFLATCSLGAIWSSCSPDFGVQSVVDRFLQIKPKVLITVDGYQYGGKPYSRMTEVAALIKALPTLEKVVLIPDHYIFTKDKHAKRNIDIFPEHFMFQLTDIEVEIMVSQNAIPSRQPRCRTIVSCGM